MRKIIAVNSPHLLKSNGNYKIVSLGCDLESVDFIIIMLAKGWGNSQVAEIESLSAWIELYPSTIPCVLAGCETIIPDLNFIKYKSEVRDNVIFKLCSNILGRSNTIGVRGEITFKYLTEFLGFNKNQIDIIYGDKDSIGAFDFCKKNNIPSNFLRAIEDFQKKPYVMYEKPICNNQDILISMPYMTSDYDQSIINVDLSFDNKKFTLWLSTKKAHSEFLVTDRLDAFVCAILPFAMRIGKNIICDGPVTNELLHNINEILIPHLSIYDDDMHHIRVQDKSILVAEKKSPKNIGAGMSCGVDSFYTCCTYYKGEYEKLQLTHLYVGNYLYGNSGVIYERAQNVAGELGLDLVATKTNLNEIVRMPHLNTHFYKTIFGVLCHRKMFKTYFYSSAEDFGHFNLGDNSIRSTVETELLLLYVFSYDGFSLYSGGAKSSRFEKTKFISGNDVARKYLNVCLYPNLDKNCGVCDKCIRTLLTLDALDALDNFSDVFDILDYADNRLKYIPFLIKNKRSPMLKEVYKIFLSRGELLGMVL